MQDPSTCGLGGGPRGAADDGAALGLANRLTVRLVTDAQGIALSLEGELDLETTREFDRHLAALDLDHVRRVLIDLRGVSFMDSRGLSSIIRAHQLAQANGHDLVVRRGSNQVQRLFALTGVDERLTFEDD
jgi:anti-sigma B factor antagonist